MKFSFRSIRPSWLSSENLFRRNEEIWTGIKDVGFWNFYFGRFLTEFFSLCTYDLNMLNLLSGCKYEIYCKFCIYTHPVSSNLTLVHGWTCFF